MARATLNLRTKLEHQSIRDSRTGLFNRHFMQISLERELSRAAGSKQTLAVFMLDIDHFKRFDDTHGHIVGDAVLREIAHILQSGIGAEDVACRLGGEEFTILMPDATVKAACERAERILESVAQVRVTVDEQTYGDLTVSAGISFYPCDGEAADLMLRRADEASDRSKKQGRNRSSIIDTEAAER
jgi:diguanylate cyclase (GGDEF)-like protein